MPTTPSPPAAPAWTVHSVPVRTRDGPQRLDQVYRRLLANPLPTPSAPGAAEPARPCDS